MSAIDQLVHPDGQLPPQRPMVDREELARARAEAQPDTVMGPDGVVRTIEDEFRLNEVFKLVFRDELGEQALAYLRSISLFSVHGPAGIDPNAVLHKEGMRYLLAIIDKRVADGKAGLPRRSENQE